MSIRLSAGVWVASTLVIGNNAYDAEYDAEYETRATRMWLFAVLLGRQVGVELLGSIVTPPFLLQEEAKLFSRVAAPS